MASAGALVTAGALALPATAGQASPGHASASAATHRSPTLTVRQIAFGKKLHHMFRPNGTGAWTTEALSDPDDITMIGRHFYVTFQNNLGPQGQASPSGDLDSTLVEFTLSGSEVRQWDVAGHCDGLTADPSIGQVIATVNEDANSSLFTIAVGSGRVMHYAYNKPLPHNGGTDAISVYRPDLHQRVHPGHYRRARAPAHVPGGRCSTTSPPTARTPGRWSSSG